MILSYSFREKGTRNENGKAQRSLPKPQEREEEEEEEEEEGRL